MNEQKAEDHVLPYRVEYGGQEAIVWASSAGKARYKAALALAEACWMSEADPSKVSCRRAPECDHIATAMPGKCYHPEYLPKA